MRISLPRLATAAIPLLLAACVVPTTARTVNRITVPADPRAPAPVASEAGDAKPGAGRMAIQFLGGEGELGNRGWSEYDSSWVLNANFSTEPPEWPVGIEMGFQLGAANGSVPGEYRDLDWWELYCGATKTWTPLKHLDLQAGVGGRLLVDTLYGPGWFYESEIDNDASLGVYLHAGAWWMITPAWGIGIDARWADGMDMRLEGEKRDAALTQLLLGVRLVL